MLFNMLCKQKYQDKTCWKLYNLAWKHTKTQKLKREWRERVWGVRCWMQKKRCLKVTYKEGNCNADVNKGNAVLVKVKDAEQMWQEAGMVEWSTPVWTGKQNASEQKVGTGMGCLRLTWKHCLCVMNIRESYSSACSCYWWRIRKAL